MAMHMRNRTTLAQCISSARARADRLRVMLPWVAVYFGRSKPRPPRDVDKHQSPILMTSEQAKGHHRAMAHLIAAAIEHDRTLALLGVQREP